MNTEHVEQRTPPRIYPLMPSLEEDGRMANDGDIKNTIILKNINKKYPKSAIDEFIGKEYNVKN